MCQSCVPGVSVDGYDCDSDLDLQSEDECPCPHDHKAQQHHHHEHQHEHKHEEKSTEKEEDNSHSQVVNVPADPFFSRLITAAHQFKDDIIINDDTHGLQLTYSQFLHDVHVLRSKLQSAVPADLLDANGLFKEGAGRVGVLAEIQYPFFVASLAILAMGGVIVPMGHAPQPEQVLAVLQQSKSVALVFDPTQTDLATAIQKGGADAGKSTIQLPIEINQAKKNPEEHKKFRFATADNLVTSPSRPALLLYGGDSDEPDQLTRQTFYGRATGDSQSAQEEMTDAMMLCIIICLSSGPPPS